ncbi:MAG: lipocalin family protein [Bacteroidota bacterium]
MRKFTYILMVVILYGVFTSCDPLPEEEQIRLFLNKKWELSEVKIDGRTHPTLDVSNYSIEFREDETFTLINFDGMQQEGNWSLANGDRELRLFVGEPEEQNYLIISLQLQRLELQTLLTNPKTGSAEFRFIFDPA